MINTFNRNIAFIHLYVCTHFNLNGIILTCQGLILRFRQVQCFRKTYMHVDICNQLHIQHALDSDYFVISSFGFNVKQVECFGKACIFTLFPSKVKLSCFYLDKKCHPMLIGWTVLFSEGNPFNQPQVHQSMFKTQAQRIKLWNWQIKYNINWKMC